MTNTLVTYANMDVAWFVNRNGCSLVLRQLCSTVVSISNDAGNVGPEEGRFGRVQRYACVSLDGVA